MSNPFPDGPVDGDVFFHKDVAYYYRAEINTWEARRAGYFPGGTPTPTSGGSQTPKTP
jgi:hypothetical protein